MPLFLYDTLRAEKRAFVPAQPGKIGLYVCGPTVQDVMHLGHVRAYVVYDVLVRHLRAQGVAVRYVRNVTDVNDTIVAKAKTVGEEPGAYARRIEALWQEDYARVGIGAPDIEPHVTDHMSEIVALITDLIAKGKAYAVSGDVYFRVSSFPDYGKLSHRKLEDLSLGASGRTDAEQDARKEHPADFALWKGNARDEQGWDSPWGFGRPGWHIECSAMAMKHLGETFDLHTGGLDLVFPHHENEIAQSEAATGKPFARCWMHHGFIEVNKEKMSKSLGNFFTLRDVCAYAEPEAVRLFVLSTHYRSPLAFEWSMDDTGKTTGFPQIEDAERRVESIYAAKKRLSDLPAERIVGDPPGTNPPPAAIAQLHAGVAAALDDDVNGAVAIAVVSEFVKSVNEVLDRATRKKGSILRSTFDAASDGFASIERVLGLGVDDPAAFLLRVRGRRAARKGLAEAQIEARIGERLAARSAKDFARADAIRAELAALGVELMDDPAGGTRWSIP